MERERIGALLEMYWQGETTLDDERVLKKFLTGPDVPEEWKDQAAFFQYLEVQQHTSAPDDDEILAMLEGVEPEKNPKGKQIRIFLKNAGKVAAVIFIVAAASVFVYQDYEAKKDQMEPVIADTFEDPQKAFEETKKALMMVSRQFDRGKKHAQKLTVFDEATDKVQKLEREL